jgi:1,4-dihydroxy-2-naphthoate octaprenyltransferase
MSLAANGRAYARLLKLAVPELSLFPLIAFGITARLFETRRYWAVHLFFLAFSFCSATLTITLDDIMGFIDGVDQPTHLGAKRNIAKPLLSGELTVRQAVRAALVLVGSAALVGAALIRLSPHPFSTALLLMLLIAVVSQYSFGLKLSYHGLGELVIIAGAAMATSLPCWILTGKLDPRAAWTAAMVGLPYAAQVVISNAIDHDTDKAANRRTLTVMLGLPRAPWLSAALLALFWVFFAVGLATHNLPPAALLWLVLLPNHARFLVRANARKYAAARLLSFRTIRLQLALLPLSFALAAYVPALG